ncbi:MAG: hypothetical protein ACP5SH_02765 [Syntrophobacteraceae bacterium]
MASATPKSLAKALKAVREHGLSFWGALLLSEDFQHTRVLEGEFCNPFEMDDPLDRVFKALSED